jgi:4-amino-4-deoxy-L-arabinose transferase-like glycosyltransferase
MLGSARLIALAAGTLYILVPVNIMQSNTTYIDSAYASCVIAAIALATASLNAKNKSSLLLIGLGAAVGLALSSRPTAIILAAFIAIALPAWHYVLHRTWAISATKLLIAAAIALLVCGYWYGRNYYYTGSPVYPAGVCAAGYTIFPGQSIESTMHASKNVPPIMRDWSACRRIFATWTQFPEQWPQTVTMVDARFGGLGFMFLPCVAAIVVVLALLVQHKSNSEIRTLLFPLAIVIVLFIATPSNWWPRYTLWLYAIALPSLAVCISGRLGSRDATWERFGFLILCFVFIVAATEGVVCAVAIMRQGLAKDGLIYRAESHVAAASEIPFAVLGGSAFDAVLASNDAVAAGPLESQFDEKRWKVELLGVLSMPVGGRRLRAIPKDVNQTDLNHMAAEVNWIIWDETVTVPEGLKRFPSQCIHGFRLFKITH